MASTCVYHEKLDPEYALRAYVMLYNRIAKLKDHICVADFEQVTTNLSNVVRRINLQFGSDFRPFVPTSHANSRIFQIRTAKTTVTTASWKTGVCAAANTYCCTWERSTTRKRAAWTKTINTIDERQCRQVVLFPEDREIPEGMDMLGVQVRLKALNCTDPDNGAPASILVRS